MAGKKGDQLPALTFASIDGANDLLTIFDASATGMPPDDYDKKIAAVEFLKRMLSTNDISHLPTAISAFATIATGDGFLFWDQSATAIKLLNADVITTRSLGSADVSWMSTLGLTSVASNDSFLVFDLSATAWKLVTASELLARIAPTVTTDVTTTPYAVGSGTSGQRFTNRGATQVVTLTLPALTAGMRWTFHRVANYALRIDPNGTETIGDGGAGKYLEITGRGAVQIECLVNGSAEVVGGSAIYQFEA